MQICLHATIASQCDKSAVREAFHSISHKRGDYKSKPVNLPLRNETCQTRSKILDKPRLTETMAIDIIVASDRAIQNNRCSANAHLMGKHLP